jgi:hypothetical protein
MLGRRMSWSSADPVLPPLWPPKPRMVLETAIIVLVAVFVISFVTPLSAGEDRASLVSFRDGDYSVAIREQVRLHRGVFWLRWSNFGEVLRPYQLNGSDAFCRVPLPAGKRANEIASGGDLFLFDFEVVSLFQSIGDRSVTVVVHRSLFGVLLIVLLIPAAWRRWQRHRFTARIATNRCPHCGFDLRATPRRCPECGRG